MRMNTNNFFVQTSSKDLKNNHQDLAGFGMSYDEVLIFCREEKEDYNRFYIRNHLFQKQCAGNNSNREKSQKKKIGCILGTNLL